MQPAPMTSSESALRCTAIRPTQTALSVGGLRPALELRARAVRSLTVPAGAPVGYSGTWIAERPSVIATLPIGYADGYARSLSPGSLRPSRPASGPGRRPDLVGLADRRCDRCSRSRTHDGVRGDLAPRRWPRRGRPRDDARHHHVGDPPDDEPSSTSRLSVERARRCGSRRSIDHSIGLPSRSRRGGGRRMPAPP